MSTAPDSWSGAQQNDSSTDAQPLAQSISYFWRFYWLFTIGVGLLGFGLLAAQANPDVAGLLMLGSLILFALGFVPSLVMTVEQQVEHALKNRFPDYQHRWSTGAWGWFIVHWLMLVSATVMFSIAATLPRRGGQEVFISLASLLSVTYVVLLIFVLTWRSRRKRLATMASAEDLRSFELVMETEEIVADLTNRFTLFSGKLKGRCPYLLRRQLNDWPVLLLDWLDINKQPPRREWITVVLVGMHRQMPNMQLQPIERVAATQLHWWHIFLEFPFGLIIFLVGAISHVASKLKSKPALMIAHTPGLTRGYQLDSFQFAELQRVITPPAGQLILTYVNKKKRFLMISQEWLLLGVHKKEMAVDKLAELVTDALRVADGLEEAGTMTSSQPDETT